MPENFVYVRLSGIQESITAIQTYLKSIQSAQDFDSFPGSMTYDAILMRLQVIGENIKALHKKDSAIFTSIQNEVSSIIRFRDIISHHYEKLDTEIVFDICLVYLPALKKEVELILNFNK